LNRRDNIISTFHKIIIAGFLLSLSACGYKAPPYYQEDVPKGDKNVEFHYKAKSFDTNETNTTSCQ
jgi:predicted small lipoprotein YifL